MSLFVIPMIDPMWYRSFTTASAERRTTINAIPSQDSTHPWEFAAILEPLAAVKQCPRTLATGIRHEQTHGRSEGRRGTVTGAAHFHHCLLSRRSAGNIISTSSTARSGGGRVHGRANRCEGDENGGDVVVAAAPHRLVDERVDRALCSGAQGLVLLTGKFPLDKGSRGLCTKGLPHAVARKQDERPVVGVFQGARNHIRLRGRTDVLEAAITEAAGHLQNAGQAALADGATHALDAHALLVDGGVVVLRQPNTRQLALSSCARRIVTARLPAARRWCRRAVRARVASTVSCGDGRSTVRTRGWDRRVARGWHTCRCHGGPRGRGSGSLAAAEDSLAVAHVCGVHDILRHDDSDGRAAVLPHGGRL
eukprot:m.42062 g.42062  ORF g.42062 m.42062 type:complete len:366 (-) comp5701_c0_seq1:517-1614(-)